MAAGQWRSRPEDDNAVGRHLPPSSERVTDFMRYFEQRYNLSHLGTASRIMAIPAAHHRLNFIHPFPDGNGRVSRLMSHAMAHQTGIGAHGLWSISRGLARGLESRAEYRRMMDMAHMPRQGDLDGRGNLSLKALKEFVLWFLRVCLDQVQFMSGLFDLNELKQRLRTLAERSSALKPQAAALLEEALMRGEFERGEVARITGLPERTARRVLTDVTELGIACVVNAKGSCITPLPRRARLEELFPRLYPQSLIKPSWQAAPPLK